MTRANNRADVILWSRVSSLMRRADTRAAVVCARGNVRVEKGDAEKCTCGANGGECNATRAEPAAECSSEPNSEVASSLGYCAQKQERRAEGRRKRGSARNGSHREPRPSSFSLPPARPFIIADAKRDVEARRVGDTDPPAGRYEIQKISFIFQYLDNTGSQDTQY